MADKKLPAIYLKPPQGYLVSKGKKTLIVSPVKDFSYIEKEIYAVSGDKIYGTIELSKPYLLDHTLFKSSFERHQISEEERQSLWPNTKQFWAYVIKAKRMFPTPKYCGKVGTHNLFIKEIAPKQVNEVRLYNGSSYKTFQLAEDEVLVRTKVDDVDNNLCLDGDASFKLFYTSNLKQTVEGAWQMQGGKAVFVKKKTLASK